MQSEGGFAGSKGAAAAVFMLYTHDGNAWHPFIQGYKGKHLPGARSLLHAELFMRLCGQSLHAFLQREIAGGVPFKLGLRLHNHLPTGPLEAYVLNCQSCSHGAQLRNAVCHGPAELGVQLMHLASQVPRLRLNKPPIAQLCDQVDRREHGPPLWDYGDTANNK